MIDESYQSVTCQTWIRGNRRSPSICFCSCGFAAASIDDVSGSWPSTVGIGACGAGWTIPTIPLSIDGTLRTVFVNLNCCCPPRTKTKNYHVFIETPDIYLEVVDPLAFGVWYLPLASKINFEFLIGYPRIFKNATYRLISPSWSSSDHLAWSWHELVWLDWHCWHKIWTASHLLTSTHNCLNILKSMIHQNRRLPSRYIFFDTYLHTNASRNTLHILGL